MSKGRKRIIPVPVWKWVLAYVALGFGVLGFFMGFQELPDVLAFVSNQFLALMFLIPSGWWFYCTAKDEHEAEKAADMREMHEQTSRWLGPQDGYFIDALSETPEAKRINRRWPIVVVVTLVCFSLFGVLNSDDVDAEPVASGSMAWAGTS